jgi:protein SCO1/2
MTPGAQRTQRGQRTQRAQRAQRTSPFGVRLAVAFVSFLTFVSFVLPPPAAAQMATAPGSAGYKQETRMPSSALPEPLRGIGFDQNIDQRVPLDTVFRDESGATVELGDYFGKRPVVLVFAYYDCPMLCTQVINGLSSALGVLTLVPGKDFEIVTVSFNPRDTPATAAAKKAVYLERYKQPGASESWHFLTGDQPSIERLTQAAGFHYAWDADTKQFAHPSGIIVLTPDGRLARYLFGIEYSPRGLRFGIIEASAGKVGTPVDSLLLYCYHYDPMTGRYGLVIMRVMRLAGAATVFALGAFILIMLRREKARGSTGSPRASDPLTLSQSKGRPELVEGRGRR